MDTGVCCPDSPSRTEMLIPQLGMRAAAWWLSAKFNLGLCSTKDNHLAWGNSSHQWLIHTRVTRSGPFHSVLCISGESSRFICTNRWDCCCNLIHFSPLPPPLPYCTGEQFPINHLHSNPVFWVYFWGMWPLKYGIPRVKNLIEWTQLFTKTTNWPNHWPLFVDLTGYRIRQDILGLISFMGISS